MQETGGGMSASALLLCFAVFLPAEGAVGCLCRNPEGEGKHVQFQTVSDIKKATGGEAEVDE